MRPILSCITCISTLALRVSQREREAVKGDTTMVYSVDSQTAGQITTVAITRTTRRGDLVSCDYTFITFCVDRYRS